MEPLIIMDENRIGPVKTHQSKFTLFLILVVSVTALVLVILVISGKIGPKCLCRQGMCLTEFGQAVIF